MYEDAVLEDDELAEDDESDDESLAEDDEIFPLPLPGLPGFPSPFGARRRGVRTAPDRPYATPGMTVWVARPEFNQALSKVRADIAKNSQAIKQVNTKVAAEAAVNARQNQAIVRQNKALSVQAKAIAGVRKEVKKAKDNALLMSLLMRPKLLPATTADATLTFDNDAGGEQQEIRIPKGTRFAFEGEKNNNLALMFLLMDGLGDNMALPLLIFSGGL